MIEVKVPDIGDFKDVPVIEVMVKAGDRVKPEDSLVSLESDKATMDVPAPLAGVVKEVRVKVGDKVTEGTLIMTIATDSVIAQPPPVAAAAAAAAASAPVASATAPATPAPARSGAGPSAAPATVDENAFALAYAGPGVRKLARE